MSSDNTEWDYLKKFFGAPLDELQKEFSKMERFILSPYWLESPHEQHLNIGKESGAVVNDADRFLVNVDVSQFLPSDLHVNVKGKELVIEGCHDVRNDTYGTVQRCFVRKYRLPEDSSPDAVRSSLSDTGLLTVEAPKRNVVHGTSRRVPIEPVRSSE